MRRLAALPLVLALAACAGPVPGGGGAGIAPGTYRLTALNGAPPKGSATLTFAADGSFTGEGPCNQHRGRNTARPPGFHVDGIVSTRRMCIWEAGEGDYLKALEGADRIIATGPVLGLAGPGGTLDFIRE